MRKDAEELNIRFADAADTPAVTALWTLCFPGDEEFRRYFFARLYRPEWTLLLLRGNRLCAMAQMRPCRMQNGCVTENATYIYGACTHPDCRRQHLMDRLLRRSFELDRTLGRTASVLIPQEDWLFGFYARFGYAPVLYACEEMYDRISDTAPAVLRSALPEDLSAMDALYHAHMRDSVYLCRDEAEWRRQMEMFRHCGGAVCCTGPEGAPDGYAFVWPSEDTVWAQELICPSGCERAFAAALEARFQAVRCRITGPDFSNRQPLGCVLRHDGARPAEGYINLMLN